MRKNVPGVVKDFIDTLEVYFLITRDEAYETFTNIMRKSLPYDLSPIFALQDELWELANTRIPNKNIRERVKANLVRYVTDAAELFSKYENYDVVLFGVFKEHCIDVQYDKDMR